MPPRRDVRHFRLMHRLRWRPHYAAADVVADRLQPLKDGLPLRPIELAQKGPQSLNERILEQRLARGLGNEEAIQSYAESLGNFLERSEAGRHLPTLDTREI